MRSSNCWVKRLKRHKTLTENCGTRSTPNFSDDSPVPFLDLAIDQNWELDSMLVAAPAAHPKSSHDVDAMPAGIFGYPVVSLRFLLRAGTRGRFFQGRSSR